MSRRRHALVHILFSPAAHLFIPPKLVSMNRGSTALPPVVLLLLLVYYYWCGISSICHSEGKKPRRRVLMMREFYSPLLLKCYIDLLLKVGKRFPMHKKPNSLSTFRHHKKRTKGNCRLSLSLSQNKIPSCSLQQQQQEEEEERE